MTSEGAHYSSIALFCYAPGLVFFALEGSINKWYFALQDTKTPNYWGAAMAVLNILMGYIGVFVLYERGLIGYAGALAAVSLSLTISKSAKVVILYALIRRRIGAIDRRAAIIFAMKLAAATAVMALAAYVVMQAIQAPLMTWQPSFLANKPNLLKKFHMLAVWGAVTCGGGLVFFTAAALLKLEELQQISAFVKEKVGKRLKR